MMNADSSNNARHVHSSLNVTARSDYLVVCDSGNELWAFSCYGRKVERAYEQRRKGHHILIVHERDFWDALASHGVT